MTEQELRDYEVPRISSEKEFNDEYTDKYHSLYEGYAVLLEEVEECMIM